MATTDQLEMLTGKALLDASFLEKLLDDPQEAARGVGISLTHDQASKIKLFQERRKVLLELQEEILKLRGDSPEIKAQRVEALAW